VGFSCAYVHSAKRDPPGNFNLQFLSVSQARSPAEESAFDFGRVTGGKKDVEENADYVAEKCAGRAAANQRLDVAKSKQVPQRDPAASPAAAKTAATSKRFLICSPPFSNVITMPVCGQQGTDARGSPSKGCEGLA
jgi:hypothetical protein